MTDELAEGVPDEIPDEIIAKVSDYLDNTLPQDERAGVEAKLASEPMWKRAHEELLETRKFISGMRQAAPRSFDEDVTGLIHKRSAGRFFGRRTFGDRVPFGALVIVALAGLAVIAYVLWSSSTGSLRVEDKPHAHGSDIIVAPPSP
jgi:anti-sigma factor RsiW